MKAAEVLLQDLQALGVRLAAEGEVLQVDAPRGVLTAELRAALVAHKPDLLTCIRALEAAARAHRVAAFRAQLADWAAAGRIGAPLLTLPDAPAPQLGHCVSCGAPITDGPWRCATCLAALDLTLGLPPRTPS